jgi:hypothetical protein
MRLARELGTRAHALPDAVALRNRRRALLQELGERRAGDAPPRGTAVERLLRAADLDDPDSFDDGLLRWMQTPLVRHAGPRLLLAGSAPPDGRLHAAIERVGGNVIDECGDHSARRLGVPIPLQAAEARVRPQAAFERMSSHNHGLQQGPRAFVDRAAAVGEQARRSRVDGVLLWLIEEDESLAWCVPGMQRALTAAGIPHLTLARSRWDAGDGALEAASEFTASLGARS